MKKIVLAFLMVVASWSAGKAYELPDISNDAQFYMIACEPGQESYTKYGHAAIRVVDQQQGLDVSFNWGVFSFESPNFIGRFVVGKTDYELAVWHTEIFLSEYRERGSAVHQYHINLDSTEKQTLWNKMRENYEPKNRVYRYNFIFDNCATRVVNMILQSYDSIDAPSFDMPTINYRTFVKTYTHPDNFMALGIDLVFGKQADKVISARESATFPLQAMELLAEANVKRDTVLEPILTNHTFLCNADKRGAWREYSKVGEVMMCLLPLAILAFMIAMFLRHKRYHYERISTQIVLWTLFVLSLLLLFLRYFTVHPLVDSNYNILWCNPITLVLAITLLIRHHKLGLKTLVSFITWAMTFSYIFILAYGMQSMSAPLFCWWIMVCGCETLVFLTYMSRYERYLKNKAKNGKQHHHHHHHRHHLHLHHHHHHHDKE